MNMVTLTNSDGDESNPEITCVSELTPDSRSVTVLVRIISMSQARQVRSNKTNRKHLVQDAVAGDSTAKISMTLWNEDVDSLQEGHTYFLTKGYVREYDECMYLVRSRSGEFRESAKHIEKVNESVDMSRPFAGQKPYRKSPRTKSGRSFRGTPGREEKGYCSWKGF
jgi:ssDNA-binding replication factor A large subunit